MGHSSGLLHHPLMRSVTWPALIVLVYSVGCLQLLPAGISHRFIEVVVGPAAALLVTVCLLVTWLLPKRRESDATASFRFDDWVLLLLPMGSIGQYLILNVEILSMVDMLVVTGIFAVVGYLVLVVVPGVFSAYAQRSTVVSGSLTLMYLLVTMPIFARLFNWHEQGDPLVQLALLIGIGFACFFLYRKDRIALKSLCVLLFFFGLLQPFVLGGKNNSVGPDDGDVNALAEQALIDSVPAVRPDIFLLTYDSYVENETMLQYGIDNSGQERWLSEQGFSIYRGTYSIAATSRGSMGRVMARPQNLKQGVSGNSPFLHQLNLAGYKTQGIFDTSYFFEGVGGQYDHSYPPPGSTAYKIIMAVMEGEFRHNSDFQKPTRAEFLQEKRSAFEAPGDQPMFLYTHTGPGHSQNSGRCLADETKLFADRLKIANEEMRIDVETILANQRDAIIIINGDHGPYLTKNCDRLTVEEYPTQTITRLDLQDRYGSFLAIKWPEDSVTGSLAAKLDILQDVTPAVLGYIYPNASFEHYRLPEYRETLDFVSSEVTIREGIIQSGKHAGEPLYLSKPLK